MIVDRRLLRSARSGRWLLLLAVGLGWAAGIFTILQASALSRVVTGVFLESQTTQTLLPWMVGLLGIFAARGLCQLGSEIAAHHASVRIRQGLRQALVEHILALGPAYTQGEQTGEQATAVLQGVDELDAYFSQYLPQLALSALVPVSVLVIAFPLDWLSALVMLLTAPLIPLFMALIGQASAAVTRRQFTGLGRMSAFLLDTIQGLATLKLLNQSAAQAERIAQVSERYRKATLTVLRVAFLSALILELVGTLSTAVIAVQIGLRLLDGGLAFEQAFFILLLAPEFYLPLRLLGLRFHAAETGRAAARRIFEVLAVPKPPGGTLAEIPAGGLRVDFEGVGFGYPNRPEAVLEDVTFTLYPGQVTALVGFSGAGKSTIASLLMAFIRPQVGRIRVNGVDLASVAGEAWREKVAWMPQQAYIFEGSIAENLRIADGAADLHRLEQAARRAHLDGYVHSLPKGYDTLLGEGGAGMSGGQAQRLGLARAFLADAPLLVADEPTAWLDVELADALAQSLRELSAGRTVLVIAHRPETIRKADWVVVVEAGRVVEQGRPAELVSRGGWLARLLGEGGPV